MIKRCFAILRSFPLPIFKFTDYKNWNRTDVFHCKRNKFVQTVLCSQCLNEFWLYWISDSTKMNTMELTSMLLQLPRQVCQLYCPFSVSSKFINYQTPKFQCLLINECLPNSQIRSWTWVYSKFWWLIGRTILLQVFARFVSVFHPSSVMLDASFGRMSLLQIKHFSVLWFIDRSGFLSSSISIYLPN